MIICSYISWCGEGNFKENLEIYMGKTNLEYGICYFHSTIIWFSIEVSSCFDLKEAKTLTKLKNAELAPGNFFSLGTECHVGIEILVHVS